MNFWEMAYRIGAIDKDKLHQAVKCSSNPEGEITPEDYKRICGEDFNERV